jgi:plasmid maintenance system antidote protein VapI
MRVVEPKEAAELLCKATIEAGGQIKWSKKIGVARSEVNKAIHGKRPLSKKMVRALGLRVVYVRDGDETATGG